MVESTLPGLMGDYTDEQLNAKVVAHAKYFTVVQITRGGFVKGGSNYDRHQVDTLEDARKRAKELYEADKSRGILIYAVADFAGANGFSRPIENYPKSSWMSKSEKAQLEKEQKRAEREAAKLARAGSTTPRKSKAVSAPMSVDTIPVLVPEGFDDADEALAYVTLD